MGETPSPMQTCPHIKQGKFRLYSTLASESVPPNVLLYIDTGEYDIILHKIVNLALQSFNFSVLTELN